jgi:type I restriction enzyme M protein
LRSGRKSEAEPPFAEFPAKRKAGLNPDPFLLRVSGQSFYNTSPMDMGKLMGDQDHIREERQL